MDVDPDLGTAAVYLTAKATELLSDDERVKAGAQRVAKASSWAGPAKAVTGAGALAAAVSGASGASIMSSLATAGAVIGGGVVAGVGLVGGGAGVGAAALLNKTVFKDDRTAKVGTYTGAALGTAGSLGTLAVTGAGPAGLATIGGLVGGGMAAGAITVLALPVACAAVVGGLFYHLRKRR